MGVVFVIRPAFCQCETQGRAHLVYKSYFCRFYRLGGAIGRGLRGRGLVQKGPSIAVTSQMGGDRAKGSGKIEGETGLSDGRQASDHDQRTD